jgi:hypothetical protein
MPVNRALLLTFFASIFAFEEYKTNRSRLMEKKICKGIAALLHTLSQNNLAEKHVHPDVTQ